MPVSTAEDYVSYFKINIFYSDPLHSNRYDFVEISDVKALGKPLVLCGFRKPSQFNSKSNIVEIKFQTDSDQEFKGFVIAYKSVPCENPIIYRARQKFSG